MSLSIIISSGDKIYMYIGRLYMVFLKVPLHKMKLFFIGA